MQCLQHDLVSFAVQSSRTEEGRLARHGRGQASAVSQMPFTETSDWTLAMWSTVSGEE